jgi:hypothetical protein
MLLRKLFGRKDRFDDAAKVQFAATVAEMLLIQMTVAAGKSTIEDDQGHPKRKALGYMRKSSIRPQRSCSTMLLPRHFVETATTQATRNA